MEGMSSKMYTVVVVQGGGLSFSDRYLRFSQIVRNISEASEIINGYTLRPTECVFESGITNLIRLSSALFLVPNPVGV